MNKSLAMGIMMLGLSTSAFGQTSQKFSDKEMTDIKEQMAKNPECRTPLMWLEDDSRADYYIRTAPDRCPDELEELIHLAESWHQENSRILQLAQQIYPKPGSAKSEKALAQHFNDTEKAKQTFECARKAEERYTKVINIIVPLIDGKRHQTFKAPQGELIHFEYHSGGGMIHKPASHGELERLKDGSYIALLDTYSFEKLDTVAITPQQVDTIRTMLIEGEAYKMPRYHDEHYMIFDAPSSSVSVEFSDASFSCSSYPPTNWGGKNIYKVYLYLKAQQPKREMTEEEKAFY
ncbi:MAG: hypothetical protein J5616_07940 [Bacteroidaceae bacterium]|nr:hypothetical protein [Bacteroidaceae bacterium]